jgi:tRNA U38,U39,U40 pseudouridine synthase TruA
VESSKTNEFWYLKAPPRLIQEKRFIKYKKNIKKIWKILKILFGELDFTSFHLVIRTCKTNEWNSKKGHCECSNT